MDTRAAQREATPADPGSTPTTAHAQALATMIDETDAEAEMHAESAAASSTPASDAVAAEKSVATMAVAFGLDVEAADVQEGTESSATEARQASTQATKKARERRKRETQAEQSAAAVQEAEPTAAMCTACRHKHWTMATVQLNATSSQLQGS